MTPKRIIRTICFLTALGVLITALALAANPGLHLFKYRRIAIDQRTVESEYQHYYKLARDLAMNNQLARTDGYTLTVDAAHLMRFAARIGDQPMYLHLRKQLIDHCVKRDPSDPFTDGFVAWRSKPDTPSDASGTTEGLRVAQALWLGAEKFDRPQDRKLAIRLVKGYARHAATDQGIWLIRNYFNFQTRHFATNTFTIDYDPDLITTIAEQAKDPMLKDTAEKCVKLVKRTAGPTGLLHELIQPEINTAMPTLGLYAFSPNGIANLANSATVAESAVHTCPDTARRVLQFVKDRHPGEMTCYYNVITGEPADQTPAGIGTLGPLIRLAIELDDRRAVEQLLPYFLGQVRYYRLYPYEPKAYVIGEAMMTLRAARAYLQANSAATQHAD